MLIPLILRLNAVHGVAQRHGRGFQIGANADQAEPRLGPFWGHAVKHRLDPDHRGRRGQKLRHLPFDRTARAFGNAHGGAHFQGACRVIHLWQRQGDGRLARRIGAGGGKAFHHRVKGLVVAADQIAGKLGKFGRRAQPHFALNRQISAGGAEQVFRIHCQIGGVAEADVRVGQGQRKVDAFGQEIFDQKGFCAQRCAVQIGEHLQPPDAARRAACDGHLEHMATRARIGDQGAGVFDAIGALEDCGQRQSFHRARLRISGKGSGKHRFACPVSPPVGGQEHINRRCGLAPFYPTV